MRCVLGLILFCAVLVDCQTDCPDEDPDLIPWEPVSDPLDDVIIDGEQLLLTANNVRLRSITIQNGGKLVISDRNGSIYLEVKYILIQSDGELHAGSETCRFQNILDIMLYGRSDDTDIPEHPTFGRKFIGVDATGTISMYGMDKRSWTFLVSPLTPGETDPTITLSDTPTNWAPGDSIVIASSTYNMTEAEEFIIGVCGTDCGFRQLELIGLVRNFHQGVISPHGVDTRAEVGLLSRNIRIRGEIQSSCYGSNYCQFFDYDTYGGHIQIVSGFKRAELVGLELFYMGQQVPGRHPIYYNMVGRAYGSFIKHLSIHHCFSRCVAIHGTEGLTVQDVVGYDTLGHCFFLSDGNEQYNQLIHNLGLVTRPSTLLPSERDQEMCESLLDDVHPGYVPDAEKECMEVATFWISHPNNTVRNNSAAGSENNGFHYVFYREPTGPSAGSLPPFHGERTQIPMFIGNKAHSNGEVGLLLDRGVKIDVASQQEPSEFLSMADYARYMPHEHRNLMQPRQPSIIVELTAYRNHKGAVVRGGDVWIQSSKFSDNDVGVVMLSEEFLPEDAGSHRELTNSILSASEARNSPEWYTRTHPCVGIQLVSGPALIDQNTFYAYTPDGGREAYAIGFYPQYPGQFSTANVIGYNAEDDVLQNLYFGRADPASIHGSYDSDGDLFQVFYDRDGTATGWPDSYAVRLDTPLMRGDVCYDQAPLNAAYCVGVEYGQIFVNASTKSANMTVERLAEPYDPVVLRGANKDDTVKYPDTTQYQMAVVVDRDYHIYFNEPTPSWVQLSAHNFPENGYAKLALDYDVASAGDFQLTYIEWKQMEDTVETSQPLTAGSSVADVDNDLTGMTYFWDDVARLLYIKLVNRYPQYGYDYCAEKGCQIVEIITP